jgi:hypothetical protein
LHIDVPALVESPMSRRFERREREQKMLSALALVLVQVRALVLVPVLIVDRRVSLFADEPGPPRTS